ncbi:MAG: MATE family efflux transporter [Phycisphaerae bacterium]|nr:MATE family efflux transporter [Phycisphaerae bacterium]
MSALRDPKRMWGLGEVFNLAWPAAMTMLNATVMRFVDGLMVGQVGPGALSAQFYGGMAAFVPESFGVGALTVVSTFVSQNYGAGRPGQCARYGWAGVAGGIAVAVALLPLIALAGPIFRTIGHAEAPLEAMYFRYMIVTGLFAMTAVALEQFFYGVHRPRIVFVASTVANAFNIFINYVLIFGRFGLPRLELQGAAIGTLISFALLMTILSGAYLGRRAHARYGTRRLRPALSHVADLFRVGWPAGVQLCNNIAIWYVFMAALVGQFGLAHRAAGTVVMRYRQLAFLPAIGIGIAATALVGRYIGARRTDLARRRAHVALGAALTYMTLCGLAFFVFRRPLIDWFVEVSSRGPLGGAAAGDLAQRITRYGGWMMIAMAIFQFFHAFQIIYVRALRGAGDTLIPMLVGIVLSWSVAIGGGVALVAAAPGWKSIGPWVAINVFALLYGAYVARRFERGAWRRTTLVAAHGPGAADAPEPD